MKVFMLVAASVVALTAGTAASWAASLGNDEIFCKAIGLDDVQRPSCFQDMSNALNADDRDAMAAKWVAVSPLASNSPQSLYKPPVDDNRKNGAPASVYKDKVSGVPNSVSAQINRAMKMNDLK